MNSNVDSLEKLIEDIHKKINREHYIFLIEGAENSTTCALYDIKNNTAEYSNETAEFFDIYIERISSLMRGKGVLVLSKDKTNKPVTKSIPFYNPELFHTDLFDLIIYQEFGMQPVDTERQDVLKQSLLQEKVKDTLAYACWENNTARILECLKNIKKSELDKSLKYHGTPLGFCAKKNNMIAFKHIAEAGADVGKVSLQHSTHTPLWIAFRHSSEIVKYIYSNYPEVFNKEIKKHGFNIALETRDISLLNLLFELGVDINSKDPYFPYVHCFADYNNVVGLEFILDKGADINLKDKNKQTAIAKAKMRGNKEAIDFLRNRGAVE